MTDITEHGNTSATAARVPFRTWRGPVRVLPTLLIIGYLGQVGLRLLLGSGRLAPHIYEDEACLLVAARWLTGGPGADFTGITFHPSGYALLLTPAYLLAHDPVTIYRIVITINALIGALAFPLGYLLLRRLELRRKLALPIAWAAALLPAATLYGETAMADAIMPVLVLCWLLLLDRFLRTGHPLAGIGASLAASYAYMTHARGLILLLIHFVVLLLFLLRSARKRTVLLSVLIAGLGFVAAYTINGRLSAALYPGGANDLDGILRVRLLSFSGQVWAISCGIGQIWAMAVGTFGLGGIGIVLVARRLLARNIVFAERLITGALLALTLAIAYASSAAFPDWHRTGNLAYGRYLTCVGLIYSLIAISALLKCRQRVRPMLTATALVATTGTWVFVYGGDHLRTWDFQIFDFPEVSLLGAWEYLSPPRTSITALTVLLLLIWTQRFGRYGLPIGLACVSLISMTVLTILVSDPGTPPFPQIPGRPYGKVAVDDHVSTLIYSAIANRVDWTMTERVSAGTPPGTGVCAVVVRWPESANPTTTWPTHPDGWRARGATTGTLRWVVWSPPRCLRA